MSIFASTEDLAEVRSFYDDAIRAVLYETTIESVAEMELRALATMPAVMHPGVAVEPARLFVQALEECADEVAVDALTTITRLASVSASEAAGAAVARLAVDGVEGMWSQEIGRLEVVECQRARLMDDVDAYTLVLARPNEPQDAQGAIVTVGPGARGEGDVVGIVDVTLPLTWEEVRERVALHERLGQARDAVDPAHLEDRMRAVLGEMVSNGDALEEGGLGPLCVLDRALTGRAASLPRPLLWAPDLGEEEEAWEPTRPRRRPRRRRSTRRRLRGR